MKKTGKLESLNLKKVSGKIYASVLGITLGYIKLLLLLPAGIDNTVSIIFCAVLAVGTFFIIREVMRLSSYVERKQSGIVRIQYGSWSDAKLGALAELYEKKLNQPTKKVEGTKCFPEEIMDDVFFNHPNGISYVEHFILGLFEREEITPITRQRLLSEAPMLK
ncbi:MAG: hypothetical protein KA052_01760 [Candidatus Pacebacteria bacterium]|nr:hypothetical protein [Candidatus Paceibacterota bacterium]